MRRTPAVTFLLAFVFACRDTGGPTLNPGPPTSLQIVSGDQQTDTVGQELPNPLVVRVLDSTGQRVPGQIVNFRVTAGGGTVFAGAAITNDLGEARERWTLGTVAGDSQRVEARAVDAASGLALVFGVFRAVGTPGAPAAMQKLAGDGQSGIVGQAVVESLAVRVVDAFGNPVTGASVAWTATSGGGSVSPASVMTNTQGVAKARWTLGSLVGVQTATGAVSSTVLATFTASSAAPNVPTAVIVIGGNGQRGPVGLTLSESLVVRVTDQDGINVAGVTVTWTVTGGGGSLSPGGSITNTAGITKAAWTLGAATGPQGTAASVAGVAPAPFSATAFTPFVFSTVSSGGIYLDAHTCGITEAGETYCWGAGGYGRLGNGSTGSSAIPVRVSGGLTFTSVTAGGYHTCALTSGGQAYCWGRNNAGQLGNGSTTDAATPVLLSGGLTFVSLDAGAYNTCGVTSSGAAYCWGANTDGQLGDGSTTSRLAAVPVTGGLTFSTVSAGGNTEQSHTCGVTTTGAAYCWGKNGFGQLGSSSSSTAPVAVSGGLSFETVDAGGYHTCGRATSGTIYCWGYNFYGQLGNGSTASSSMPVAVSGGIAFAFVRIGGWTSCGATSTGAGYCWGWGHYGARGDGLGTDVQTTPTPILGGLAFARVTPGSYQNCGRTTTGKAYCWGYNADGEVGDGSNVDKSRPSPVRDP